MNASPRNIWNLILLKCACLCLFVCFYVRPPRLGVGVQGVRSPGGGFTGVEGDQRRGRSSGVVGSVGWWDAEWLEMEKRECSSDGGPGAGAPWLSRGPPKAGLAASFLLKY